MKKFILKSSIIFLFALLLFRFTVISLINEYEQKLENYTSSTHIGELKNDLLSSLNESNQKEQVLNQKEALIIGTFIKKILKELDLNP
jgi:hypothetical protein